MAVADVAGVDAAKGGRTDVIDPSAGQVASVVARWPHRARGGRDRDGRSGHVRPGRRTVVGTEPVLDLDVTLPGQAREVRHRAGLRRGRHAARGGRVTGLNLDAGRLPQLLGAGWLFRILGAGGFPRRPVRPRRGPRFPLWSRSSVPAGCRCGSRLAARAEAGQPPVRKPANHRCRSWPTTGAEADRPRARKPTDHRYGSRPTAGGEADRLPVWNWSANARSTTSIAPHEARRSTP